MLATGISRKAKKKGYISSTNLALFALASSFFSRLLWIVKFPSAINFLHFATVPFAFGVTLLKSRSKDKRQLAITRKILFALLLVVTVGFASALINDVGVINVILQFLLFNEPIMLLLTIISIPMAVETFERFRAYVLGFGFFHLAFALVQKFILRWDSGRDPFPILDGPDTIVGVFFNQGAGCIIGAGVCIALATHCLIAEKRYPIWLRILTFIAALVEIQVADAKQVLIFSMVAFALLSLSNVKDIRKTILMLVGIFIGFQIFWWAIFNIEELSNFSGWVRPEIYGPDGEATKFKLFGVRAILERMHTPLHWLFGLGPGHTVDRLGMLMLKEFGDILNPLGATRSTLGDEVWTNMADSWLSNGSTMFSPFFCWAAIWGDVGILGVCAYLYLYSLLWRYVCQDDLSRFQMLSVFVMGWIQTGMQEPGLMLYIAALMGLRWQTIQLETSQRTEKLRELSLL